jgi:hypothetical protein
MDEQQRKAFEQAVERKKQAAREASQQGGNPAKPPDTLGEGSQQNVIDPSTSQDQPTPQGHPARPGDRRELEPVTPPRG